jgi:putative restriction endonuclease
MRYWWVNQNQTYRFEVPGGFLWSPKTRADGGRNYFYRTMEQVRPGDLVFSFCDTYVKAIGIVQRPATTAPKPTNFGVVGTNWAETGWFVEVEFSEIENPVRPKDFMETIRPLLEAKYAPLQRNGNGLQGLYLTEISKPFADLLVALSRSDLPRIEEELSVVADPESDYEIELEIQAHHLEGDLEKIQLSKSRRGQGIFKANVRLIENHCRVTGVTSIKHLRASHIKPWAKSNNQEKLDGSNGLLLSPHVDHLFDRGFISFQDQGEILVSSHLHTNILDQWGIEIPGNVGSFHHTQTNYLDYHRRKIFQS